MSDPKTVAVVLAYPYKDHPADATVELPAGVASDLLAAGLARAAGDAPAPSATKTSAPRKTPATKKD